MGLENTGIFNAEKKGTRIFTGRIMQEVSKLTDVSRLPLQLKASLQLEITGRNQDSLLDLIWVAF